MSQFCGNCHYYHHEQCRRYAPRPTTEDSPRGRDIKWPYMWDSEWCGEWRQKESKRSSLPDKYEHHTKDD